MNQIRKLSKLFCLGFFMWTLFGSAPVFATGDPVNMLNSISEQLISELKANKTSLKSNPALVYSLAQKIVVPHADMDVMSKKVLPPKIWNTASTAQRAQFKKEFTTMLVHTYASALANYNDQVVRFNPVRGGYAGKNNIQVTSVIERSDGPSVSVNYRLISTGSGWKLYDLSVEGVSMIGSFRSQFSDQLNQGNIDALIQQLAQHNDASSSE